KLLRGHPAVGGLFGSPSKQSEPAASMSRQKPQNTLCWAVTGPVSVWPVLVIVPVDRAKAIGRPPISKVVGGGQSWVVGKSPRVPTTESAGVQAMPSLGPPWHLFDPAQEPAPAPGQSASVLHGPPLFVPALQVWLQTGHVW